MLDEPDSSTPPETTSLTGALQEKSNDHNLVYVATDGGCVGNGKKGQAIASYAYVILEPAYIGTINCPYVIYKNGSIVGTAKAPPMRDHGIRFTYAESGHVGSAYRKMFGKAENSNNKGELLAIYYALCKAEELNITANLFVISDSVYSINCITTWYPKWVRENTLAGKQNLEIIQPIYNKLQDMQKKNQRVMFQHVRSHMNEISAGRHVSQWFYWYLNGIVDQMCQDQIKLLQQQHNAEVARAMEEAKRSRGTSNYVAPPTPNQLSSQPSQKPYLKASAPPSANLRSAETRASNKVVANTIDAGPNRTIMVSSLVSNANKPAAAATATTNLVNIQEYTKLERMRARQQQNEAEKRRLQRAERLANPYSHKQLNATTLTRSSNDPITRIQDPIIPEPLPAATKMVSSDKVPTESAKVYIHSNIKPKATPHISVNDQNFIEESHDAPATTPIKPKAKKPPVIKRTSTIDPDLLKQIPLELLQKELQSRAVISDD